MTDGEQLNVLGEPLEPCSLDSPTGFTRSGSCEWLAGDPGAHLVCAAVSASFLAFSSERGNDLSTPAPALGFPGLRPGDLWCLCLGRWLEALEAGCAPRIRLRATHQRVLEVVELAVLKRYALDLS